MIKLLLPGVVAVIYAILTVAALVLAIGQSAP